MAAANTSFDSNTDGLVTGISSDANSFATTFNAQVSSNYLMVRSTGARPWAFIDDFELKAVPEPSALSILCVAGALCYGRRRLG